jgi:ferredoxin-NADP reductase
VPLVRKHRALVRSVSRLRPDLVSAEFGVDSRLAFLPGQFLHVAFAPYDGVGQWPDSRCFSIQTSPSSGHLRITFAIKGAFTRALADALHPGATVWLKLPYGDLFQRGHSLDRCVFIAGGTGLTPFLSLLTDTAFAAYRHPTVYALFRSACFNVFEGELQAACGINPTLDLKVCYEDLEGRLDPGAAYRTHGTTTYFLSGPPDMIAAFRAGLQACGVPAGLILSDDWE